MRIRATIPVAATEEALAVMDLAILRGMKGGLAAFADGVKKEMRSAVKAAGFKATPAAARRLRQDFEKSFRADLYPAKKSQLARKPAVLVAAQARFASAFETGASVGGAPYLAIPLPDAVKLGFDRGWIDRGAGLRFAKVADIAAAHERFGTLRRVPTDSGYLLSATAKAAKAAGLAVPDGQSHLPLFAFVRQVQVAARYDITAVIDRWADRLPDLVETAIDKGLG